MLALAFLLCLFIGGGLITLLIKLLKKPIKWAFKLLLHALFGFVSLFVFNQLGARFGITLEMTWLNAIVAGVLGVPGVLILLATLYLL